MIVQVCNSFSRVQRIAMKELCNNKRDFVQFERQANNIKTKHIAYMPLLRQKTKLCLVILASVDGIMKNKAVFYKIRKKQG